LCSELGRVKPTSEFCDEIKEHREPALQNDFSFDRKNIFSYSPIKLGGTDEKDFFIISDSELVVEELDKEFKPVMASHALQNTYKSQEIKGYFQRDVVCEPKVSSFSLQTSGELGQIFHSYKEVGGQK